MAVLLFAMTTAVMGCYQKDPDPIEDPSGNVSVREGGDQTFTITPDKGYAVSNVKIDGKRIGAVKSYTFENVRRPHTIEVIFVKGTASASTGDSSNLPLWSALLLASTLTLAGAVHLKRKRAR